MNPKQVIPAYYERAFSVKDIESPYLEISELFCDTIQGEGAYLGTPCTFLRLQWCTQNCVWCDTQEVWRQGNKFEFDLIFDLLDAHQVIDKLWHGQHLVLTGGSPLRQQDNLVLFFRAFHNRYSFKPIIQIENECTLMPSKEMINLVHIWNNSPKLESSGNNKRLRYRPEILKVLSGLKNSWFKFVVSKPEDWLEIEQDFLMPNVDLIQRDQIILMPQGATREELHKNRQVVIDMAIEHHVRYSSREHIEVWDKKTGI